MKAQGVARRDKRTLVAPPHHEHLKRRMRSRDTTQAAGMLEGSSSPRLCQQRELPDCASGQAALQENLKTCWTVMRSSTTPRSEGRSPLVPAPLNSLTPQGFAMQLVQTLHPAMRVLRQQEVFVLLQAVTPVVIQHLRLVDLEHAVAEREAPQNPPRSHILCKAAPIILDRASLGRTHAVVK
jgi:hypothetical protein